MLRNAGPTSASGPLTIGERFGKYSIGRLVGDGGMGCVYEARHDTLDELFALKILKPAALTSVDAIKRFITEARAAARIKSAHVVRVVDVATHPTLGTPYMVMELLEGEDLANLLDARGRLPIPTAVDYVLEVLEALAEAHALGIVHRDLKPSNLFLARGSDGRQLIKVLDFGIAKATEAISLVPNSSTATNQLLGTPAYMSPEQLRSSKHVDARADIWAIGVVLFELMTGDMPFAAQTVGELFASIFEDEPPLLRSRLADAPEEVEHIVSRCLQRKAERRFADVEELATALVPFGTLATSMSLDRIRRTLAKAGAPSQPSQPSLPALPSQPSLPASASHSTLPLQPVPNALASLELAETANVAFVPTTLSGAAAIKSERPRPIVRWSVLVALIATVLGIGTIAIVRIRAGGSKAAPPSQTSVAALDTADRNDPTPAPTSPDPPRPASSDDVPPLAPTALAPTRATASATAAKRPDIRPTAPRATGGGPAAGASNASAPNPKAPALFQHDRN